MSMSRKDYRAFAEIMRSNLEEAKRIGTFNEFEVVESRLRAVAEDVATVFRMDNPAFDRIKFMEACGL